MALIFIFLIAVALIVVVWLFFKFLKHGVLAIFFLLLIVLVLFSFFTLNAAFNGKEISINNITDVGNAFKVYFSWFANLFGNIKSITGNAVKIVQNSSSLT